MTEYEMASLANELLSTATTLTTTYFTVASGFIVGAYIAAHRLSRTMVAVVVGLFLLWSLSSVGQIWTAMRNYYGLLAQIRDASATNGNFGWYATEVMPRWFIDARPLTFSITLTVVALVAVYFFFHCRRVNRIAEIVAAHPKV